MKELFLKKRISEIFKNTVLTVLGTVILAFGTAVFLIPFDLIAGGVSGIAIVLAHVFSLESAHVDIIIAIATWGLFALGFFTLGKSFATKTLVSTLVYPAFISLFLRLPSPDVLGGYFDLQRGEHSGVAFILAATIGGTLVGIGCAIAFLGGGSTGGIDVIAFLICKLFPRLQSSKVIFAIDALIVLFGVFVINDMTVSLLGVLSALMSAFMIDKIFLGGERALIAEIVSEESVTINDLVIRRLGRTTTMLDAVGGYTGEVRHVLRVSFRMSEYRELLRIIGLVDKRAFITVYRAYSVNGEGWSK